jgi:anti-sigma factor RsiW
MTSDAVDLTCREVSALVTEYLNRGLAPESRAMLEQHVFACPSCTIYLSQMKTIVEIASSLPEAPAKPADDSAVLQAFRRWKQR